MLTCKSGNTTHCSNSRCNSLQTQLDAVFGRFMFGDFGNVLLHFVHTGLGPFFFFLLFPFLLFFLSLFLNSTLRSRNRTIIRDSGRFGWASEILAISRGDSGGAATVAVLAFLWELVSGRTGRSIIGRPGARGRLIAGGRLSASLWAYR